jgi:hypothetical protein
MSQLQTTDNNGYIATPLYQAAKKNLKLQKITGIKPLTFWHRSFTFKF